MWSGKVMHIHEEVNQRSPMLTLSTSCLVKRSSWLKPLGIAHFISFKHHGMSASSVVYFFMQKKSFYTSLYELNLQLFVLHLKRLLPMCSINIYDFCYNTQNIVRRICCMDCLVKFWLFEPASYPFEAETERSPFCRQHSQVHFVEWKCLNSD